MDTQNTGLTPKQHASQALQAAETVLVVTGQRPTQDQTAAVIATALVLRKLGKKVTAMISDPIPTSLNFLPLDQLDKNFTGLRDFVLKVDLSKAEVDKLKYTIEEGKLNVHVTPFRGSFAPSDVTYAYGNFHYDLIVALGVPTRNRLDKIFQQNANLFDIPIVNVDFHRSNENYGAINLIDPMAGSLSEILLALGESMQQGLLDEQLATVMLAGIMANTDRFTASHTTAKSLTVAAQLMAAGANQQQIVKALYGGGRPADKPTQSAPKQQQAKPAAVDNPAVEEILPPAHIEPEPELTQALAGLNATVAELGQGEAEVALEPVDGQQMRQGAEVDLPNEGEHGYQAKPLEA